MDCRGKAVVSNVRLIAWKSVDETIGRTVPAAKIRD